MQLDGWSGEKCERVCKVASRQRGQMQNVFSLLYVYQTIGGKKE